MSDAAQHPRLGARVWDEVGKVPGVVVILGVLYAVVVWGIGPVKPQSQIDLEQQRTAVSALAAELAVRTTGLATELAKQTAALAADLAKQTGALSSDIAGIKASPGGSLRQQDITEWTGHLTRLDGAFEAQRDKVAQAQYDIKDLQQKYQQLTTTAPTRK
jgi:hypothetical protein